MSGEAARLQAFLDAAGACACIAFSTLSRPAPNLSSTPAAPRSVAVSSRMRLISLPPSCGQYCFRSAAAPAIAGAAKLLPVMVTASPSLPTV